MSQIFRVMFFSTQAVKISEWFAIVSINQHYNSEGFIVF